MIQDINKNSYPNPIGSGADKRKWETLIDRIIPSILVTNQDLSRVDFFNYKGESQKFLVNDRNASRLVVFAFTVQQDEGDERSADTEHELYGKVLGHNKSTSVELILDDAGIPIAQYVHRSNEVDILFDIFRDYDKFHSVFKFIMEAVERQVMLKVAQRTSWKHTGDREGLKSSVIGAVRDAKSRELDEDRRTAQAIEAELNSLRTSMKSKYDRMILLRRNIESHDSIIADVSTALERQLDQIADHPRVIDLIIKDGLYHVHTDDIIATDKKGQQYRMGRFQIVINPSNSDIKFHGTMKVHGYWTDHDPHPHVNGSGGNACLGNVADTIAQLCSQYELYALVTVCINYLEAVNIDDPAGARVTQWPRADQEDEDAGEVVETGYCSHNDMRFPMNDLTLVYDRVDSEVDEHGEVTDTGINPRYCYTDELDEVTRAAMLNGEEVRVWREIP
jgi:hypothetical protein